MADTNYPLTAEEGHDDLPRTFRRAKEEKERAEKARAASGAAPTSDAATATGGFYPGAPATPSYGTSTYSAQVAPDETVPATVKRLDVPFVSLMFFFIKAVLAAIPALLLLGAIIWFAGELLQTYFPWLIKMQIFIHFPE